MPGDVRVPVPGHNHSLQRQGLVEERLHLPGFFIGVRIVGFLVGFHHPVGCVHQVYGNQGGDLAAGFHASIDQQHPGDPADVVEGSRDVVVQVGGSAVDPDDIGIAEAAEILGVGIPGSPRPEHPGTRHGPGTGLACGRSGGAQGGLGARSGSAAKGRPGAFSRLLREDGRLEGIVVFLVVGAEGLPVGRGDQDDAADRLVDDADQPEVFEVAPGRVLAGEGSLCKHEEVGVDPGRGASAVQVRRPVDVGGVGRVTVQDRVGFEGPPDVPLEGCDGDGPA